MSRIFKIDLHSLIKILFVVLFSLASLDISHAQVYDGQESNLGDGDFSSVDPGMVMDRNGDIWKVYSLDGFYVFMNVRYQKKFGKYYRVDLYIQNNTGHEVFFNFKKSGLEAGKKPINFFTQNKFNRRMKNRAFWSQFGVSMAVIASAVTLDMIFNGDYLTGYVDDYSFGEALSHELMHMAIYNAAVFGSMYVADKFAEDLEKTHLKNVGYLENIVLQNNESIRGHAYAKMSCKNWHAATKPSLNASSGLIVTLEVNNRILAFRWPYSQLEKVTFD